MSVRVCSGMWGTAWERYGERFMKTFETYWSPDIELKVLTDKTLPTSRCWQIKLQNVPAYRSTLERWRGLTIKFPVSGAHKDFWKYDFVKWFPQALAPFIILNNSSTWIDGDILVWLDADIETINPVNEAWIEDLVGDYDVACLRRDPVHTEIGFYAVRLSPETRQFIKSFAAAYTEDLIFELNEWHSAYVWDRCLEIYNVRVLNLNPTKSKTHVFPLSPLAEKMIHYKGHRKPGGG